MNEAWKDRVMFLAAVEYGREGIAWAEKAVETVKDRLVDLPSAWYQLPAWSEKNDGLIAYYSAPLKPAQTRIKPGKFLRANFPCLTDSDVQELVEGLADKSVSIYFSRQTGLKAADIYKQTWNEPDQTTLNGITNISSCPITGSCMRCDTSAIRAALSFYDNLEFADLAYTMRTGKITARTMVNTLNKQFSRVYALSQSDLEAIVGTLQEKGFAYDEFALDGLTGRVQTDGSNRIYIPYIDGSRHGFDYDESDETATINLRNGRYSADSTSGIVTVEPEEDEDGWTCACCDEYQDYNEDQFRTIDYETICCSCRTHAYYCCTDCGNYIHQDDDYHSDGYSDILLCGRCFERGDYTYAYCSRYDQAIVNSDDTVRVCGDFGGGIQDGVSVTEEYAEEVTISFFNSARDRDCVRNGVVIVEAKQEYGVYEVYRTPEEIEAGQKICYIYRADHDTTNDNPVVDTDDTEYKLMKNAQGETYAVVEQDWDRFNWDDYCLIDGVYCHFHNFIPALPGMERGVNA